MPVAEALARVLADAEPLAAEAVPLAQAHGRVLAADVAALRTQPPADVSAMDGYAGRSIEVAKTPAKLKLVGEVELGRRLGHVYRAHRVAVHRRNVSRRLG